MYQVLAGIFILIGIGFLLRTLRAFDTEAAFLFNRFVLYISFPCLVYRSLFHASPQASLWKIPPLGWAMVSAFFIISFYTARRFFKLGSRGAVSFAMVAAFGNTSFLGYPFVMALLGEEALPPAIFFDQMANFLSVFTVGIFFCVSVTENRFSWKQLFQILKFPPFIAFLLALTTRELGSLPRLLEETINRLAEVTVPLTMVAIGISLSLQNLRGHLKPLFGAALIKLFFLPLAMLGVSQFFSFSPLERGALVMESAMPTLMTSYVIASLYQLDAQFVSSGIVLTTLLALGSLPLWGLLF